VRDGAEHVVSEIRRMGKQVILMSGDNEKTAQAIARKVRIANVLSEVSPEAKAQTIKKLQSQSRRKVVAMVGDCINDAPALTQAEFGIAMGSDTDVAMALGHVIMMKSDLEHVILALKIGMYAFKKIKENLAMSFAYNYYNYVNSCWGILPCYELTGTNSCTCCAWMDRKRLIGIRKFASRWKIPSIK
jgi:P-type Cu+ transporter